MLAFGALRLINSNKSPALSVSFFGLLRVSAILAWRFTSGICTGVFASIAVIVKVSGCEISLTVALTTFSPGSGPNVRVAVALPLRLVIAFDVELYLPAAAKLKLTGTPANAMPF